MACRNNFDMKFDPRLVCITLGSPTLEKKLITASTIFLADIALNRIASGNRVAAHIIVRIYLCLAFVSGNGPTQSTITRLNGSSTTGISWSGAGGYFD